MSNDVRHLDDLLRALAGDAGCTAGESIIDAYVDFELAGQDGLLEAARAFGDIGRE